MARPQQPTADDTLGLDSCKFDPFELKIRWGVGMWYAPQAEVFAMF